MGIKVTQEWINNILKSRKEVYEQMSLNYSVDPCFFIKQAVRANWNHSEKHFNMVSGNHRTAFLVHSNRVFIPLLISRDDFNEYLNTEAAAKLLEFIKNKKMNELPYPLYLPYFRKLYSNPYSSFFLLFQRFVLVLERILYYRAIEHNSRNISIVSYVPELEPILQMLNVVGYKISIRYLLSEFDKLVRKIYRTNDMNANEDLQKCDIVFCKKRKKNIAGAKLLVILSESVDSIPNSYIIHYKNCFIGKTLLFTSGSKT